MWTCNKDFHQPQFIHPTAPPDPRSPAAGASRCGTTCENGDPDFLPQRRRNYPWKKYPALYSPNVLCTGSNLSESWAPLVVWAEKVFRWVGDRLYGNWGGKSYKTLQGLKSRSKKWNIENVTGVYWHVALWASLKRFKRRLGSESGRSEYESPAREDMLHSVYSV